MSTDITRPGLERPASRADLARQLLARVDRLEARLSDVSLATEIQLLKRELARGHAVLTRPEDNNYLSVVCLVEAALVSLTWKLYTPVLAALRRAFSAGTREGAFTYEEYAALRRHFRESDIPVGPTYLTRLAGRRSRGRGWPASVAPPACCWTRRPSSTCCTATRSRGLPSARPSPAARCWSPSLCGWSTSAASSST